MPTIKLNQALEYDFEGYVQGNTFDFYIDFFQDTKETVPTDLTGSSFVMDFMREDGSCCFEKHTKESLTMGDGLSIGDQLDDQGNVVNTNNRLNVSKILQSLPGTLKQSITWTDSAGKVFTCEKGTILIEKKV